MTEVPDKSAALEFREVSISFEDRVVLDRVSFSVPNGEMRVIVGPSNSGKSTLLKLAIGLLRPDAGQISLFGREITSLPEEEFFDLRQQIGVVFQTDALFSMSVADNVAYRLNELGWEPDRIEGEVRRVLRIVGLAHAYDMAPEELSGGMSRRTAVARGSEPVLRREANDVCVANTRILMLSDGKIIFDEQDELFWTKDDERIQRYLT
jgi:phospholipid/cholesterol/gamma-HCH transport system ATP-binding protein